MLADSPGITDVEGAAKPHKHFINLFIYDNLVCFDHCITFYPVISFHFLAFPPHFLLSDSLESNDAVTVVYFHTKNYQVSFDVTFMAGNIFVIILPRDMLFF